MELKVEKRAELGKKVQALRTEGKIPAVVYGKKEESTSITLSLPDFEKVWKEAGESTVITLIGLDDAKEVLIQEVDVDPVFGTPRHVDFYAIEKGKKVSVSVPLEFVGVSPAEKELGGTLVKVLHDIEVEAFPKDLPHSIEADISGLRDFETQLHAGEIALPQGVELVTGTDEVVALVAEAKEEEAPVEELDMDAIEVMQKGKKEEEGDEDQSKVD